MLTIQILASNNINTIKDCFSSIDEKLYKIKYKVIVGDYNSSDGTLGICKQYGAKVVKVYGDDLSRCRNRLVEESDTDWQFLLNPWEVFYQGTEEIVERVIGDSKSPSVFSIFTGDFLSKEVRLWNKKEAKFTNRVFERLTCEGTAGNGIIISDSYDTRQRDYLIASKWIESEPAIADPLYYKGCLALSLKKYDEFITCIEKYLFKDSMSNTQNLLSRYYLAKVYAFIKQDYTKAIEQLSSCILSKPLYAEFWCLLGDIHFYLLNQKEKAKIFYENAIFFGSRRSSTDDFPMEISRYDEYPKKMLEQDI